MVIHCWPLISIFLFINKRHNDENTCNQSTIVNIQYFSLIYSWLFSSWSLITNFKLPPVIQVN